MPLRRLFRRSRSKASNRSGRKLNALVAGAANFAIESLEHRRLLTTLSAPLGIHQVFDFWTPQGGIGRIAYSGVTFEAIGVVIDKMTGFQTVADLTQHFGKGD